MSRPLLAGITALGLVAACNVAQALPTVYLGYSNTSDPSAVTTLISGSWNPLVSVTGYTSDGTTSSGAWYNGTSTGTFSGPAPSTNGFTINSLNGYGNFNPYQFQSNSLTVSQNTNQAGTIYLWATLMNVPLSAFSSTIFSGLTEQGLNAGWTVTENTYYSNTNSSPYSWTSQLASYAFNSTNTPYGTSNSKYYQTPDQVAPTNGYFSVTAEYIISAPKNSNGQSANATISMHSVPEPSDLGMMGLGLMIIGLLGLKMRQKKYRSESLEA